jgi:hypothetical protein
MQGISQLANEPVSFSKTSISSACFSTALLRKMLVMKNNNENYK